MWTDFFLCLFLGFFGVHKFKQRKVGMGIIYLCTFGIFGIGWFIDSASLLLKAIKGVPPEGESSGSILLPDGTLPIVVSTSLITAPGETCHYSRPATSIIVKNKVVGYSGGNAGISLRIAKGITYRMGASKGAPVRRNVEESYPGTLSITNQRIVFVAAKGGFDKKIAALSSMTPCEDGLVFQFSTQSYILETKDVDRICQIISYIVNSED